MSRKAEETTSMLRAFLAPETTIREAGNSSDLALGEHAGQVVTVTLGITRIIEQESLDVSIWGSLDGSDWGIKPLAAFPQKFYCGTYEAAVDLTSRPEVKFLRARWQVNRWGRGDSKPLFMAYVFAQAGAQGAAMRA
jgi:hypothetical protein